MIYKKKHSKSFIIKKGNYEEVQDNIAAAVLGMPVYVAFAFTIADEITKIIFAVKRFKSGKWIQNMVECT